MEKKETKLWIPFYVDKWLFGSTRIDLTPEERGVWIDLLAIAAKDDGHIRANVGVPYPLEQLSGFLRVPVSLLRRTITKCLKKGKLTRCKDRTLFISSWSKYQFTDRHRRRVEPQADNEHENAKGFFGKMFIQCPPSFSKMATKNNLVRTSRLFTAIAMGRQLKSEEQAHHRDGNEKNNYPENLMLFKNQGDHSNYSWGAEIKPLWDGSKLTKHEATLLKANIIDHIKEKNKKEKDKIGKDRIAVKTATIAANQINFNFKERKWEGITIEDKAGWLDAYPACDINLELSKMREWLLSNPDKKKKRYRRFIVGWLSRTQDKGGSEKFKRHPGGRSMTRKDEAKKDLDDWEKKE